MPFCPNCGKTVSGSAKFCYECGGSINIVDDNTTRKQEFAGKITKCPSCGSKIPSFTAFCPECSHEISSARVTSSIKDFTEKMTQCDLEIAESTVEIKKGWSSWGIWGKIGWVLLNIVTYGIPVIISLILRWLGLSGLPRLTTAEKNKVKMIDNFAFPNDRESILEALLFVKFQVSSLSSGKIDQDSERWIKIWKNKANQLYEKAEIMFKGDKIATDAYNDILKNEKRIKISLIMKIVFAVVFICFFVILYLGFLADTTSNDSISVIDSPLLGVALLIL
jgi:predicted nucleic acid-binding Zn ribbon protein